MSAVDSLNTVTAADTSAVVAGVNALVAGWGIPPQIVNWLSGFLLGLPTIAVVLLTRLPIFRWIAPPLHAWLDPVWERNKTWLLPLLALLVGWIGTGNPLVGAAAVALHQIVTGVAKAAKGTAATVGAGRVGALILCVGLLAVPGPARAGSARATGTLQSVVVRAPDGTVMPVLSLHRFVASGAFGEGWAPGSWSGVPSSYARVAVGYQALAFLQLSYGARRHFARGSKWSPEAEARIILAP